MNFASLCAQTTQEPTEVYISATNTAVRCPVLLPPVGNKSATAIELNVYGKSSERFLKTPKGSHIYVHGAKLRHDLESRTFSLHGGVIAIVNESFPILNTVILSGRCVKDINEEDKHSFKTTAEGLMIVSQSLSVSTGKGQADLFNFYAINSTTDRFNQAELLANMTRKGTGLTIQGRLITDSWLDKETKERKSNTKIQLVSMTLAPKVQESSGGIKAQTTTSSDAPQSLWGGKTADEIAEPWGQNVGNNLPDLPGRFDSNDANAPF
jgi:single-stranded DNA-binding protein